MWWPKFFNFDDIFVTLKGGLQLVSQKLFAGSSGVTVVADEEDEYQNVGGSLDWNASGYFENILIGGANLAIGATPTASSEFAGLEVTNANDGDTTTRYRSNGSASEWVMYDLGTAYNVERIRIYGPATTSFDIQLIEGSADGITFSPIDTLNSNVPTGEAWSVHDFTNGISYRYVKVHFGNITVGVAIQFWEMEMYETSYASTSNTADAKMAVASAEVFDPNTCIIKDENDATIGAGVVNCIEVVNGTAGNSGTLVDYLTFKARAVLASSANVQVRVQPIGAQKISLVSMSSVATNIQIDATTMTQKVAGGSQFKILSNGGSEVLGFKNRVTEITNADYTALLTDGLIVFSGLTADKTLSLPSAASAFDSDNSTGQIIDIIRCGNSQYSVDVGGIVSLSLECDRTRIQSTGTEWLQIGNVQDSVIQSFAVADVGNAGESYFAGFYEHDTTDVTLTQASLTKVFGTAGVAHAAHVYAVFAGAGTVDAGVVGLRVTGKSVTDLGVITASDSETLSSDITTITADQYLETGKKFVGQVTYELFTVSGTPTAYSLTFNYGIVKYEDYGNQQFFVDGFQFVARAAANDSGFDIALIHHKTTGWTYAATGFSPPDNALASSSDDFGTDGGLSTGGYVAFKRTDLAQFIDGAGSEGLIVKVTTGAQNALSYGTVQFSAKVQV